MSGVLNLRKQLAGPKTQVAIWSHRCLVGDRKGDCFALRLSLAALSFYLKAFFNRALKHYQLLLMPDALGCCEVNRDRGAPGHFTWCLLGMFGLSVVSDTSFLISH